MPRASVFLNALLKKDLGEAPKPRVCEPKPLPERPNLQPSSSHWRYELFLLAAVLAVFVWSGVEPRSRVTWVEETFPAMIAVPLLIATRNRFRFTPLVYTLVAIHSCILMVGGKYTYAEVPAFNWLRDHFHMARNDYDRVGHFAQGFVPAMVARELLLRTSPLRRGKWLFFLVWCACMAISACYEIFEWLVAAISKEGAEAFLGTQGDPFDTQKDMGMACVGAVVALVGFARWQDAQMVKANANIERSTSNIQH